MKIKFGNFWIARGGDTLVWPGDLANRPQRAVQESRPTNAAGPTFYDRTTVTTQLSFKVVRRHATSAQGEAWMLLHYTQFPAVADALLALTDDEGVETEYLLRGAKLEIKQIIPKGKSSIALYELTGGPVLLTNGKPATYPF